VRGEVLEHCEGAVDGAAGHGVVPAVLEMD
jgi:hypothetical protein